MVNVVVRLWLPDRPGALGQVASRIGAVGGDVIGIDILERGAGLAIDELTVALADVALIDLLVTEIRQVDGVAIEHVRTLVERRVDPSLAGLAVIEEVLDCDPCVRAEVLCAAIRRLVDGEWVALVDASGQHAVATIGQPPDLAWLGAFLAGTGHLGVDDEALPGDVLWSSLPGQDLGLVAGRIDRPFHAAEREQVAAVARIVDAVVPLASGERIGEVIPGPAA